MLRRIHDPERGASFIEYAAVILLIAAITTSVLNAGIGQRVTDLFTGALDSISGAEATPSPAADDPPSDSPSDNNQTDEGEQDNDQQGGDQPDQGNNGSQPADSAEPESGDQGPPTLGAGNLMPAFSPPSSDQVADTAGDLFETSLDIQRRAQERVAERAKEGLDSAIETATTHPATTAKETFAGIYDHMEANAQESAERWLPEYQKGNKFKAYAGGAMDAALYAYLDSPLSMSGVAIVGNEGNREQMANGQWVEALVDTGIDLGMGAMPGLKLKAPTGKPTGPDAPKPDPEAQHLADGEQRPGSRNDPDNNKDDTDEPNGNCRTNSFTPGTPVLMADGSTTPIQDVETGDEVLAFDPATGEEGPREVTDTITGHGQKTLVDITVTDTDGDTSTLTATDEHPFWAPKAGQWVDATDLNPGTWLRTSAGTWTQVTALDTRTVDNQQAHNLTIADLHTYYVGTKTGATLVHNSNQDCPDEDSGHQNSEDEQAATEKRNSPGTATGGESLPEINGKWLKGNKGNAGRTPRQIAEKLQGKRFKDFNEFRKEYWKAAADTPELSSQFKPDQVARMKNGRAPFVSQSQRAPGQKNYVLHHQTPINRGGGVYDLDNIQVVTPRYHQEALEGGYHYGND